MTHVQPGDGALQQRAAERQRRFLVLERRIVVMVIASVVLVVLPPAGFVLSIITLRVAKRAGSRWTQWAAYLVVGTGAVTGVLVTALVTGGP